MNRIQIAVPLAILAALVIVEAPACSPTTTQAVIQDITPAGACIAQQLLSGGVSDPLQIVAACLGTTIEDVIQVVEQLLAQSPDGGALSVKLADVHAKALAIKGAKK